VGVVGQPTQTRKQPWSVNVLVNTQGVGRPAQTLKRAEESERRERSE
jgi:hypothetical protein